MEIRTLRYFLAVAREENMTRAAEILHVTQPTLSKALKSLEDELGKKLFIRHSFSIRLTEEGVLLRNRAEDLISMADKIEREFISLDDISGGELYLGLAESYQIRYLARVIRDFKTRYPNLHYHITSGDTEQIADKQDMAALLWGQYLRKTMQKGSRISQEPGLQNQPLLSNNYFVKCILPIILSICSFTAFCK